MENNRFWNEVYPQTFMNDKYFEKLHMKTVISMYQCALAPNFGQFGEH